MAVVQISRIQIRRGQSIGGTGIPQLASGELAWAIDTQEVFIGNGSTSEGAPYVGNTKILTENDNILDLANSYQYKKNDDHIITGANDYVQRSLQDRLDDFVSVRSFGAVGDGVIDDTDAIQRAIDQLYLNDNTKTNPSSRVTLYFEAGTYIISDELRIPPYAHLIGAGIDSTIIYQTSSNVVMRMVDSNSRPGEYTELGNMTYTKRPRDIYIKNMNITTSVARSVVFLDNTQAAYFELCKFEGIYNNGSTPVDTDLGAYTDSQSAIFLRSNSSLFCTKSSIFSQCIFNKTGYGIYGNAESDHMGFKNSTFNRLFIGIKIGGGTIGAINTIIDQCYFDLIDENAIWITAGSNLTSSYGNTSSNNKFYMVGNNNQSYSNAQYPIIKFETQGNISRDDYFDRGYSLKSQTSYGLSPFIPNVESADMVSDNTGYRTNIVESGAVPIPLMRFPISESATFKIDYIMNKINYGKAIRTGTMHITVNVEEAIGNGPNPPSVQISDEFGYTGDVSVEYIRFYVTLQGYTPAAEYIDTMVISYINPTSNGQATMNYAYQMLTA